MRHFYMKKYKGIC